MILQLFAFVISFNLGFSASKVLYTVAMDLSPQEIAKHIDHTLLKPTAGSPDYKQLFEEARLYGFFSVCIPPTWVAFAKRELKGADVKICSVIGFPLGYSLSESKAFETSRALELGAHEVDMVANLSYLKDGNFNACEDDIRQVVMAASGKTVKVILETCFLSDPEIQNLCKIAEQAGADFVKTSTGFAGGGATLEHVALMRNSVGKDVQVKASGGIRDFETANQMIKAGASRLGTSQSVAIVNHRIGSEGY